MDGGRWTGLWRPRQNMRFCDIQNALANSFADFCRVPVPVHNDLVQSWGASCHCVFQKVQRAVLYKVTDGLGTLMEMIGLRSNVSAAPIIRETAALPPPLPPARSCGHLRVSTSQSENQRSALRISWAISPYLHVLGGTRRVSRCWHPPLSLVLSCCNFGEQLGSVK